MVCFHFLDRLTLVGVSSRWGFRARCSYVRFDATLRQ